MGLIAFTHDVGKRVCDAMGLDPDNVQSITLFFQAGSVVTAHVSRYVTMDEFGPIVDVLQAMNWKQQPEGKASNG